MASITSSLFTYQCHLPGHVRRYCSEPLLAFPWTEASKLANGGSDASQRGQQARATLGFVFAKLPYTSPYIHALVCVFTAYCTWATYKYRTLFVYSAEGYAL